MVRTLILEIAVLRHELAIPSQPDQASGDDAVDRLVLAAASRVLTRSHWRSFIISLYATCGVLPRKTIVVPKDFIEPSLKKLEPTFQVGPVLGFERQGKLVPVLPAPKIEGMDAEFVHDDEAIYPETLLPSNPSVSELPAQRIRLTEGWVRMFRQKL